jgi:hypothetical protein
VADPEAVEQNVPLFSRRGGDLGGLGFREPDGGELADVTAVADELHVHADLVAGHREDPQVAGVAQVEAEALGTGLAVGAELDPRLCAEIGAEDLLDARHAGPDVDLVLRPAQRHPRSPPRAPGR